LTFRHYVNPVFLYMKLYDVSEALKTGKTEIIGKNSGKIFMKLGKTERKSVKLTAGMVALNIAQNVIFYDTDTLSDIDIKSLECFYSKFDFNPDDAFVNGFYVQAVPHIEEPDIFSKMKSVSDISGKYDIINQDCNRQNTLSIGTNALRSVQIPADKKTKTKRIKVYDKRFR